MALISVTRLRLRSVRFLPMFLWYSARSDQQAKQAPGNLASTLRAQGNNVFWTMTVWEEEAAMRSFMRSGAHRKAMPKLQKWCEEASVVNWEAEDATLPTWAEAETVMASRGRSIPLPHGSNAHQRQQLQ